MHKIILNDSRELAPFNEKARDLRIQNKPLWLYQRDVLAPYVTRELEVPADFPIPETKGPCIVYRDNLFFDEFFIKDFLTRAQASGKACRVAFSTDDTSFREHALPLASGYTQIDEKTYVADMWYYPDGITPEAEPLIVDMLGREIGYYHVPTYMASDQGDLVFQVPLRAMVAIESWVHIFVADIIFGLFARGARFENRLENDPFYKLKILGKALYEGRQVLQSSELVQIGRNCVIDPSAIIHGPAIIGNNVTIGAGAVIDNCIIGNNVNISQGCNLMLSVVGDAAFLPFRASLFMTTFMDNSMVAQNTCLQMCVIGRNTFIGAGSTFTDFNLLPAPLRALDGKEELNFANRDVLGGCVGHNCRLGSGMIVMPARMIESDVVLVASPERRVIRKNVTYEESDHHKLTAKQAKLHMRLYPKRGENATESW